MSSPVCFRQVQNSLHQVQTCPMLRIEISFEVSVHDRFRSNFISSAQVRKPKTNQETCLLQFATATTKTIHHFLFDTKETSCAPFSTPAKTIFAYMIFTYNIYIYTISYTPIRIRRNRSQHVQTSHVSKNVSQTKCSRNLQ